VSKLNPPDHSLTPVENANMKADTVPRVPLDAQGTLEHFLIFRMILSENRSDFGVMR
jgi:hypothetical protein